MLTVVGTGIRSGTHMTPEARAAFERADDALYLMLDPVSMVWLERLNPSARSLHHHYVPDAPRSDAYASIVDDIMSCVRKGGDVCVAFYGHPGVFVSPSHEAVRLARAEGYEARMLPAISAEDCLFAELGVDPAASGCQSYEATDFLLRRRRVDPSAMLVLFQVTVIGETGFTPIPPARRLDVLADYLRESYPPTHEVVAYAASPFPMADPIVRRFPLEELPEADLPSFATLYVPPAETRSSDPRMSKRLGR